MPDLVSMLPLLGGLFMGWTLGANDAGNCFGTAVASRIVSFRKACVLCSLALIVGALLQGEHGVRTLAGLTEQTMATVLVTTVAAALTAAIMTMLALPISASQALVGAIVGIGLSNGAAFQWALLQKIIVCWVATPIGAMAIAVFVYLILNLFFRLVPMSMLTRDKILWGGLIIAGAYASYALGANNVAIATGVFSGRIDRVSDFGLVAVGGAAIAAGVLTYSRRVMFSVGSGIMPLNAFTALVAVLAMAATVHIFAMVGVPVSTSQAIVGAIIGIGALRHNHSLDMRLLRRIGVGWLMTPVMALILAAAGFALFCQ